MKRSKSLVIILWGVGAQSQGGGLVSLHWRAGRREETNVNTRNYTPFQASVSGREVNSEQRESNINDQAGVSLYHLSTDLNIFL